MTQKERMLKGLLYDSRDTELKNDAAVSRKLTRLFNNTTEEQLSYRKELLKELFASTGEKISIEPPFRCDYGCNTYIAAVINPGVTIGNNVVIGSGSVVTHDIPDNVVAAGNPCRVIRSITDEDKKYWLNQLDEYLEDTKM